MKVNFKTEGFTTVIEGTPVDVKPIAVEVELSVMEMAQGGANIIKALDMIKEYFNTPTKTTEPEVKKIVEKVHPSTDFCEVPVPKEEEKPKIKLDINNAFKCLEKVLTQDSAWKSYYGNLKFSETAIKAEISLNDDHIECHIFPKDANENNVHIYIYENRIHVDGIATIYVEKYFKESSIPHIDNLWEVIKPLVESK